MINKLDEIKEALSEFIINSTKKGAPSYAIQALPEVVKALVKLDESTRLMK